MTATAIGSYATSTDLKTLIGTTDASDNTLIGLICDRVNQYIEAKTGRVIAPITSTTYLYDGDGSRSLFLPLPVDKAPIGGIQSLTLVEVQAFTGAGWQSLSSSDYFLRQRVGMTGPFERLIFSDYPTGAYAIWPKGMATVRVTGPAGWAAIPDDITETALVLARRAWNARQAGDQSIGSVDEMGQLNIARLASDRDRETLRRYTLAEHLA